jgi:hypothetical protein
MEREIHHTMKDENKTMRKRKVTKYREDKK